MKRDVLQEADHWLRMTGYAQSGPPTELVRDLVLALRHQQKAQQELAESFALCDAHQPSVWEGSGTCVICEAVQEHGTLEAAERALRPLQAARDRLERRVAEMCAAHEEAFIRAEHAEADLRRVQAAQAALVARWRTTADALIEDVNNGHAPSHESDFARGMLSCADELAALIPPAGTETP